MLMAWCLSTFKLMFLHRRGKLVLVTFTNCIKISMFTINLNIWVNIYYLSSWILANLPRYYENFWTFTRLRCNFGLILYDYTKSFTSPTHFSLSHVRGPVSFEDRWVSQCLFLKKVSATLTQIFSLWSSWNMRIHLVFNQFSKSTKIFQPNNISF